MNILNFIPAVLASVALVSCQSESTIRNAESTVSQADTVVSHGKIYTSNSEDPWAEAIAFKDGKIVYIGDKGGLDSFIGPDTIEYKLAGELVLPGIVDSHTHPGLAAIADGLIELPSVESHEELLAAVTQMVEQNPDQPALIAGYWPTHIYEGTEGPHKRDLDAIEPDRPVVLYDDWTHSVWANSKALELAGVTRDTPDPVPGISYFQRDANGDLTGWAKELALAQVVTEFQTIDSDTRELIHSFLEFLSSNGVTTVFDAGNFTENDSKVYKLVAELEEAGRLPVRYHGSHFIYSANDLPNAIDNLKRMRAQYEGELLKLNTVKLFLDGILELRTASVTEPYLGTDGEVGGAAFSQEQMRDFFLEAHKEKIDIHIHTVGSNAIEISLNAVEEAQQQLGGPLNSRITLCHLENMNDVDIPRFNRLGVVANFTPSWFALPYDQTLTPILGERAHRLQRPKPLMDDGAIVTFSSDVTAFDYGGKHISPYWGMQSGHTRQDPEAGAAAPVTGSTSYQLSLEQMVQGYTLNGAYQLRVEDRLGSLEVGKVADLVILDQNIFEIDKYDIYKTKPLAVFMDGELIQGEIPTE